MFSFLVYLMYCDFFIFLFGVVDWYVKDGFFGRVLWKSNWCVYIIERIMVKFVDIKS